MSSPPLPSPPLPSPPLPSRDGEVAAAALIGAFSALGLCSYRGEVELSVLTTPPLALASPLPSLPLREPLATFSCCARAAGPSALPSSVSSRGTPSKGCFPSAAEQSQRLPHRLHAVAMIDLDSSPAPERDTSSPSPSPPLPPSASPSSCKPSLPSPSPSTSLPALLWLKANLISSSADPCATTLHQWSPPSPLSPFPRRLIAICFEQERVLSKDALAALRPSHSPPPSALTPRPSLSSLPSWEALGLRPVGLRCGVLEGRGGGEGERDGEGKEGWMDGGGEAEARRGGRRQVEGKKVSLRGVIREGEGEGHCEGEGEGTGGREREMNDEGGIEERRESDGALVGGREGEAVREVETPRAGEREGGREGEGGKRGCRDSRWFLDWLRASRWLGWVLHGVPLEGCTRIFAPLHLTPDRSLGSPAIDCSRQAEYAALACAWSAVAELEVAVGEGEMQRCTQIVAGLRLLLQAAAEDDQRALEAAELKLAPLVADQSHDDLFE